MTDDKGDWASYKYGVEVMISAVNDILDGKHDIGKYDDYEPWKSLRQRLIAMREALSWYGDEAAAIAKNLPNGAMASAVLASVNVLALDGGKRAKL